MVFYYINMGRIFNIYMKLLGEIISQFRIRCDQYVADIQLYIVTLSNSVEVLPSA